MHFKVSEIYHVIDGGATLVTGGTLVNAKPRPADSESVKFEDGPGESGSGIQGGTSQQIKAGDVVVIPAGVPHWFSAIEGSITYVVVRVDPERVRPVDVPDMRGDPGRIQALGWCPRIGLDHMLLGVFEYWQNAAPEPA